MQRYKRAFFIALVVVLVVWAAVELQEWRKAQQPFDYGKPTPLADDQPMRSAVCEIRRELEQLPLPIVEEHIYHEAWTEYRFAAGRFEYRPAHQIILTPGAKEFVLGHSRTELIAALAPLLHDAENGGRAASVLAGMPGRSKSELHRTSQLAEAVHLASDNPAHQVHWIPTEMGRFYESKVPTQLYGLTNMGMRLERSVPRNHRGSFEARLEALLQTRSELTQPLLIVSGEPRTGPRLTFEEMRTGEPPELDEGFQDYLAKYSRQDILIALFPVLGAGSSGPLVDMIWAMGQQDRLWPLVIGNPLIEGDPYKAIHEEIATELITMCAS